MKLFENPRIPFYWFLFCIAELEKLFFSLSLRDKGSMIGYMQKP